MAATDLLRTLLNKTILSPARREQLAYMRSVPLPRLLILNLAAFLLFTAVGLLSGIRSDSSQKFLVTGFSTAIYTGLFVAIYTLVASRKPIWMIAVVAVQVATTPALNWFVKAMQPYQTPVPFETATRLYALCALIATALSYSLFFRFIQREGRYAFRAQTELTLAHSMQQTLVPVVDLTLAGCEVYGLSLPSAKVGGDLVDAIPLPNGDGFAYLVDVAGHGLNAGILMGMVKTAVRTCLADESIPGTIFDVLNRVLPGVKEAHMYATCAAFQLNRTGDGQCSISFALAGHPPILHLAANGSAQPPLTDEQFPLGLLPFTGYRTQTIHAAPGDLLIAATDGILETCNKHGVEFGPEGIEAIASAHKQIPLPTLAQHIFDAAHTMGPQDDDRTLLLIRVL